MTGLIFTTAEEARPFLSRYRRGRFDGLAEGETAHDDDFYFSITGVGKIKATLRTERFLRQHRPDRLLHVGTCTSLSGDVAVGSLVAAAQVFEGDRIELATPTYPRMPLAGPFDDLPSGTLVTQDHMVQGDQEQSYWQRIADYSDTTGYAVAFVAATYGVPCQIVKVVTGHLGREDDDVRKTLTRAYERLASFLDERVLAA